MSWKSTLALGIVSIVIVVALAFYLIYRRPPQDDCTFLGWKQSVGIDLETTLAKLQSVKGQLGITDSQIREFDELLKDYGAKYETICRDSKAGRISSAEYNCRRQNMDRALDSVRALERSLSVIGSIQDASAQKQIALKAMDSFRELAGAAYKRNCGAAITVTPKHLSFDDHFPERSIQISNSGNSDLTYAIEEVPEAFVPVPPSGHIGQGATVTVALHRSSFPISSQVLSFYVRDNFDDRVQVNIEVSSENAALYRDLGNIANAIASADQRPTGLREALLAVDSITSASAITQNRPMVIT